MAKSALQKRTRAWATIVYEESAPENWREKLQGYMVQTFVSPLHDADLKEDGSLKKPHWHVLMMYDGVKTPEQAREVFESFGGALAVSLSRVYEGMQGICAIWITPKSTSITRMMCVLTVVPIM